MQEPLRYPFTENDVKDQSLLEEKIETEALSIFSSNFARKGRTLAEIKRTVRQGKIAEVWLSENTNLKLSDDRYHDLIDSEGNFVEVKAYNVYNSSAPYVQSDLKRIRESTWNRSKWYYLFRCRNGEYQFLEKISIH